VVMQREILAQGWTLLKTFCPDDAASVVMRYEHGV
jgi:hypothetical protein